MRLLIQRQAARDRAGIVAEQHADEVLLLLDQPLERDNLTRRAVYQLLGLTDIHERRRATALADLRELQRLLPRIERAPRHVELGVERPQAEIRASHLAHE